MTTSQVSRDDLQFKMSPEKWAALNRWAKATNSVAPITKIDVVRLGTVNARINCQLVIETCATPSDRRLLIYEGRELVWTGRFTKYSNAWKLVSDVGRDWAYGVKLDDIRSLNAFGESYLAAERRRPLAVQTSQPAFAGMFA